MRYGRLFFASMAVMAVLGTWQMGAANAKSPALVVKPKTSDPVGTLQELIGKLSTNGAPVVLVRSEDDHQWWVQPKPEIDERGYFRTQVVFGNAQTPNDTKFHLVVLVLPDQAMVDTLIVQQTVEQIPPNVSRSVEQVYRFQRQVEDLKIAGSLLSPFADQRVSRLTEAKGVAPAGTFPLIFVRTEPEGEWWVQAHPDVDAQGNFKSTVRFGNETTPAGTRFRIGLYAMRSDRDRQHYKVGEVSDTMPDKELMLESFSVESSGPEPQE
jgi:hypothetical protein